MITDFIIAQSVKTRAAFMLFCGLIALCAAILETEMVLRRVYGVIGVGLIVVGLGMYLSVQ